MTLQVCMHLARLEIQGQIAMRLDGARYRPFRWRLLGVRKGRLTFAMGTSHHPMVAVCLLSVARGERLVSR
jgi:hypothetical protein